MSTYLTMVQYNVISFMGPDTPQRVSLSRLRFHLQPLFHPFYRNIKSDSPEPLFHFLTPFPPNLWILQQFSDDWRIIFPTIGGKSHRRLAEIPPRPHRNVPYSAITCRFQQCLVWLYGVSPHPRRFPAQIPNNHWNDKRRQALLWSTDAFLICNLPLHSVIAEERLSYHGSRSVKYRVYL